jgi:primosomal protein N' (replication factor Y)
MVRRIAEVAVNVPLSRSFHYTVPEKLSEQIERGHRVLVPFGPRLATGVCVGFPEESAVPKLKPIRELLHPECRFDGHLLELTRWVASYYRSGWGEVLEAALPPAIRAGKAERMRREIVALKDAEEMLAEAEKLDKRARVQARVLRHLAALPGADRADALPRADRRALLEACKANSQSLHRLESAGWIREESVLDRRDPYAEETLAVEPREEPTLTSDQDLAVTRILDAITSGGFRALLLHGVTGSGKTEVYLRGLREVLGRGQRGLVLLPEISLTPQTVKRFREGLPGVPTAILHSMLSPSERTGQWKEIQEGTARLIIGARSAIFAPIPELGLIVVDEEHETSYKQESSPRYHARDVAVMRSSLLGVPIVLGSATPSLESIHNVRSGKYELLKLPTRATKHDLPHVQVVPLDDSFYQPDGKGLISDSLDRRIRRQLKDREQTLLFLNRRGFSTYLHCLQCGYVFKCEHCDVSMTLHRRAGVLRCHYCGHSRSQPDSCPDCASPRVRRSGVGTEKVVTELGRRYPDARVLRLDRDAVTTHRALREVLGAFSRGEYDILVGTQMVAKGHDFPLVSLVGILLADSGLHFPDFRAAERTYQLITQVSGRSGRGKRAGHVIVQTFSPEHYAIQHAVSSDFDALCERELDARQILGYPPFGRLAKILLTSTDESKLNEEAKRVAVSLREAAMSAEGSSEEGAGMRARLDRRGPQVLGPAPAPIARIQDKFRVQVLVKSHSAAAIQQLLDRAESALRARKGVDISVDVDPQSML